MMVEDAMEQAIENNKMLEEAMAEIGPKEVVDLSAVGPEEVTDVTDNGSNEEDADNGPKEVADNGPKEAAMSTPSEQMFKPLPHWIKSDKSSSGYKGVYYDEDRGVWRAKACGKTLGRYATVAQAAEAFYRATQLGKKKKNKKKKK